MEGQFVGRLIGFEFIIDPSAKGVEAKNVRNAAERALGPVLAARAAALATAEDDDFRLGPDGAVIWRASTVAQLRKGPGPLRPEVDVKALDAITPNLRPRVVDRLQQFVAMKIEASLGDLLRLKVAVDKSGEDELSGPARGLGFRLIENFGAMSRAIIAEEVKALQQDERAKLRKLGVRFGE